jgi:fucose 4-O-acetylase-like acetyltransferase
MSSGVLPPAASPVGSVPARVRLFSPVPTAAAAAATPADRDRVVDAARAFSLLVVVAGHVVMAVVAWPDGVPVLGNLLAAFPVTQALTWVLQVMPLFFLAGGAANALSWDRHGRDGYAPWLWGRGRRLLRPVWVYLGLMSIVAATVTVLAPARAAEPLMLLTTQLLWFLGVYLVVTALAPLFRPTTPIGGAAVVAGLVLASGAVDVLRFYAGAPEAVGLVNFVLVWAIPAYLGSMRARGTLAVVPRWVLAAVAVVALAAEALLIREGVWPVSMVGMPGEPVSNMAPPTVVLALHCIVLACLLTLLDGPLTRLLQRPSVWRPVTGVNLVAMTLYLWHLPVLIALTTLTHVLGLDRPVRLGDEGWPVPDGWGYLVGSVLFIAAYGASVWAVVRLLWPLEHAPLPWWDSPTRAPRPPRAVASLVAATSAAVVGAATLVLSATGLAGFPTRVVQYAGLPLSAAAAIAAMLAAGAALRWAGARRVEA